MAGSDLHMAMSILSSEALIKQGSLLEDVRIAIGKIIALEDSPAGMMSLVRNQVGNPELNFEKTGNHDYLALVSARLRGILESLLPMQRSKPWYGARDRELRDLLLQLQRIASSADTEGVTSGDTTTRQSTTVDELAKPRGDEGADEASTSALASAIAFKQDQPVSTDQDLGFLKSPVSTTEQKQRWGNPTHVDERLTKLKVVKKMVRILLADRIDVDDDGPLFLPLAGGPASGKTLLAHTLFHDARVVEKFGLRVWVHVSQRFDSSRILQEILSEVENQAFVHQKSHVREALSNRRYLIVFDDAWSENVQEWDTLMEHLPSNGTVILTSPIPAVVSCFATVKPHLNAINKKLQFKFVHLWEVIRRETQAALTKKLMDGPGEYSFWTSNRSEIMKFLLQKAQHRGIFIKEHTWFVLQKAHASYFNLPPDLRKCLLYCSVFPVGHEFHPEQLADIFVAEGGISPAMTQAQRIGFVQKLFDECFYPVEEQESIAGKRTYRMYAVMHEFAKVVEVLPNTIDQYFHLVQKYGSTTLEHTYWMGIVHMLANIVQRRRSMTSEMNMDEYFFNTILRHRRVLNFLQGTDVSKSLHKFDKMTNLRYLNLSRTDIERIPSFVMKLQFLQALILSHCQKLQKLNDTISMLVQLQKLDLEGCCYIMELPPGIRKMKSLRFLNVHGCSSLTGMPYGMGQLTNLETMLGHIVSNNGGAISELQPLVNLKMLSLEGLENISDVADARDVKLDEKGCLESLAFRWNKSADSSKSSSVAQILECLRPNQNLKELEIIGYEGIDHPSWMASTNPYLISLVVIRLVGLKKCETLPPLGLLPVLKIADISRAETISSISDSFYGSSGTFPSLEKLTFSYMSNLELWEQPHGGAVFPCLAEVTIIQCPKLALSVELPSVTKLILWMNNKMIYSSEGALGTVAQNLKHVSISFSQELIASSLCEGLQGLCRLKRLELCGCDEMTNLPRGLQHLSSLKSLTIMHCIKLETLPDWLGNLSSLTLLRLYSCPMLYLIPEVLRLRPCTHISIKDCPELPAQPSQPLETAFEWYDNDMASKIIAHNIITLGKAFIGKFDNLKSKDGKSEDRKSKDFGDNEPATSETATEICSIVMNSPGFTDEQLQCALSHLLDNEAIRKTFMGLPESERVTWMIDFLKKHFQP